MNKIAIYTSWFGNYDILRKPIYKDCDFFCFTDKPSGLYKNWKLINVNSEIDVVRTSRKYKFSPYLFLDYDYFIWQDACLVMKRDPNSLISCLKEASLGIYLHAELNTLREEVDLICALNKDDPKLVKKQFSIYEKEGLPENVSLFETTIMVMKNNNLLRNFLEIWWAEIENYSRRDQVSLPYLLWKHKMDCVPLKPGNIYHNPFFKHFRHRHETHIKF